MPIYEYQCQACGEGFEKMVRLSEAQFPACPACSSAETQKKISLFARHSLGYLSQEPSSKSCSSNSGGFT